MINPSPSKAHWKWLWSAALALLLIVPVYGRDDTISLITLNCYWFFGQESYRDDDRPNGQVEYEQKAGHLIGLLPAEPPLFIGLQEIGNNGDVEALAYSAYRRYGYRYQPLFVQGKDTATKQDVGALLDTTRGWGVYGRPSRVSDLERELSKHLVVRLTNAATVMDICVVHLRRPIGDGAQKQFEQNRAMLRWCMRHLSQNPKANVVVMGDFNENKPVGSSEQCLAVLFQARPPMIDPLNTLAGKVRTHTDGKAYDRILISDGMAKGMSGLKYISTEVRTHQHGKGPERRTYTDHFPVVVKLR